MMMWMRRAPRRLLAAAGLLVLALLLALAGAGAQDPVPQAGKTAALSRLFETPIQADWFDPAFLEQVPVGQLKAIIEAMTQGYGAFRGVVEAGDDRFVVELERAEVPTILALDAQQRIAGLLFEQPVPVGGDVASFVKTIAALPGRTSVLVLTNGERVAEHEADTPLAVGSAYKLAVLRALDDQVSAGTVALDRVVPLDPAWRSLPSSLLLAWPDYTPLTIATLANLMISQSDNTASDALLHIVGREAAEAYAPNSRPLLTTREVFSLKGAAAADLHAAWLAGDEAARRALLGRIAALPLPSLTDVMSEVSIDVEWFFTAAELCGLLAATRTLAPFRIEPGLANPRDWRSIAYKGGSEPGVLNYSTYVTGQDGTSHCVVATWNNDASFYAGLLSSPYRGLLRALAKRAP